MAVIFWVPTWRAVSKHQRLISLSSSSMNQPQGCFFGDSPFEGCNKSCPKSIRHMYFEHTIRHQRNAYSNALRNPGPKKKTASWDPTHAVLGLHGFDQPIFHQRRRITELLHDCSAKKISIQLEKIQNKAGFRRMCFFRKLGFKIGMFKISRVKILWA